MTDLGQNPTLTRLAELESRVDRLESKEREMSEVNVAATEHPGNTVAVSLHELLAGKPGMTLHERLVWVSDYHIDHPDGSKDVGILPDNIEVFAAIEEAIRADERSKVDERLNRYRRRLNLAYENNAKLAARITDYDALKARADALRDAAKAAYDRNDGEEDWSAIDTAIFRYDQIAADRAGETQAHKCVCTVPPESGMCDCMADQTAPSPTDAAAPDEDYEPNILIKGKTVAKLKCFDEKTLSGLVESIADLERWRAGVDDSLTKMKRQAFNFETRLQDRKEPSARLLELERWREETQKVIDTLQVWGVDLQKRLDALRGPEVTVTGQMVDAFWDAYNAAGPSQMPTWRGLEAALRAGGAK